jgi:hypothetical protein
MLTLNELIKELNKLDETLIMEVLGLTSEDITDRFRDLIELKEDELRAQLQDSDDED